MAMFNLMLGLRRLGHEPLLVASEPTNAYSNFFHRLSAAGVKTHFFKASSGLTHWTRLASSLLANLRRYEIDLAHLHLPKEAAFIHGVLRMHGRPVVSTFEGDPFLEILHGASLERGLVVRMGSHCMARADAVVACSRWLAKRLSRALRVEVSAIPNPIDAERFLSIGEWRDGVKLVVALARLVPVKGIDVLIRAARRVVSEYRETRFVVAGDGPLKQEYTRMIMKYGLMDVFSLAGFSSTPERLLSESYMLVMPSLYEPFGMPAAEAGASMRPVVASNTGGLAEIVVDGENGLLARPGDPADLADKIVWLLENEDAAREMGRRGRRRVLENYMPTSVAERYVETYRRVLANSR
jgi:glycosyltransferase involved in cell wall biosynthesis